MSAVWQQLFSLDFQWPLIFLMGVAALECLVAIWAATSERHWFWRGLAVWVAFALLIPIRAWEPAWLFGLASLLIIVGLSIGQRIGGKRTATFTPASELAAIGSAVGKWRFSLRDLFALVLIISLWLSAILETLRAYQPRNLLGWLVTSFSLAALSLTSYALVVSPRRWLNVALLSFALLEIGVMVWANEMLELPLALGLFLVACGTVAAVAGLVAYGISFPWRHWLALLILVVLLPICATAVYLAGPWMRHADPLNVLTGTMTFKIIRLSLIFAELSAMLVLMMALASGARSADIARHWRIACRGAFAAIGGAAALWLGSIYLDLLSETDPRWSAVKTDGRSLQLERVQRIAIEIRHVNDQLGNWQPLCMADLPLNPAHATERLELAALYQELLPELESVSTEDPESSAKAKAGFRRGLITWDFNVVSRQLRAEFESALSKEKWDAATDYALALVQLGDILARGGIEMEAQMGRDTRASGLQCLAQIRDHVPPDRLRSVISSLQRSQQERGDPALIHARQLDYEEAAYGWGLRVQRVLDKRLRKRPDPNEELFERTYASRDLQCLLVSPLLQTELAVRLFQNEQGRLPLDLRDLVPDFLPSTPVDSYSQPLVLKSMGETFVIYSIGWDRFDDGGTFSHWSDYEAGHLRRQREKGTWITHELREGEPRQYMGQPGIDFDLDTLTRQFVDVAVP